jgi:hypothetical protein
MFLLVKQFRFRFSLRTLAAAITVVGALLGLVGNEVNRLRLHRQAEERIRELGGTYGSASDGQWCEPFGPWWFPVSRDGLYAEEEIVWFNSTNNAGLRDEDLQVLRQFPRLRSLEIAAPLITDEAVIHIQGIKTLRELSLVETQVTGRGLKRLRGIPLEKLVLAGANITDETTEALEVFPDLRKLMIAGTSVTDAGLTNLKHVPRLQKLFISDSPVSDSGVCTLQQLIHLYELDLEGLAITDLGITPLAALPRLRYLSLANTRVTEAGLLTFRNTRTLEFLDIGRQRDSETVKRVSSFLPGCRVYGSGGFRCMQGW